MELFSEHRSPGLAPGILESSILEPRHAATQTIRKTQPGWSDDANFESLANLAHELRTPVQVLLGYLDILRDDHSYAGSGAAPSPDWAIIERMNSNVHELALTVENVLEFALAYASADSAVEEEIDLAELFAQVGEVMRASNRDQHLTVRVNLDGAPEKIVMQRRPLRSIVLNLAINAIKFTANGEVTISVRKDAREPQSLEIEVRDTGAGISRDLVSLALEPLVQLSHSSARRHRGLGLGLAVVQLNVKALGGSLQVESAPGAGSCFKVTIPCPVQCQMRAL
jgi:two-component system sensor histidine kinase/response regulator